MDTSESIKAAIARVQKELAGIRTGRAAPAFVEDIPVEAYGTIMAVKQLASVSVPDPRTLAISPWDSSTVAAVVKALEQADLGAMPSVHGEVVHVTLPPMTAERREKLMKLVGVSVEEGRIALRRHRDEALVALRSRREAGSISEDDFFRQKGDIEERIGEANERLEELRIQKEEELRV